MAFDAVMRPVLRPAVTGRGAYWLAWPDTRDAHPPLVGFRRWLADQTA